MPLREWKRALRRFVIIRHVIALALLGVVLSFNLNAPTQVSSLPSDAIIVDESSANFVKYGPASGWATATGTSFNYYGGSMIWTTNAVTQTENYARWSLPLTVTLPLTYEVFAFVPRYNATTINATYQVVHGGITNTRAISQNVYYAEWVSLGTYAFNSGSDNYVMLADSTGEPLNSKRIGFDAIAFAPIATPTTPITSTASVYIPVMFTDSPASDASTSRYVATVDPGRHYAMGCESGEAGEQGTIILSFGQPQQVGLGYGTLIYDYFSLASTTQIADAAKAFLRGYWSCAPPNAELRLALGVNNYKGETNANHGEVWAQMVNDVQMWLQANAPSDAAKRLGVFGGSDIEPSWNTPTTTRAWLQGYASVAMRPLYNFGACDGCPTTLVPDRAPNNGWTLNDVWFVSGGSPLVVPFPEIYLRSGVNADQWQRMSAYAFNTHGKRLNFGGALTQWQACQDRDPGGCNASSTDNTPHQGWQQLHDAVNADIRTVQTLSSPSDMTWRQNRTPVTGTASAQSASALTTMTVARIAAGDGYIIEDVQPPLSAMQFVGNNAWMGQIGNEQVTAFAGLARDPSTGGDDREARGAIVVIPRSDDGSLDLSRAVTYFAPSSVGSLHITSAQGVRIALRADTDTSLWFDLSSRSWVEIGQ